MSDHAKSITFKSNGRGEQDYDVYFLGVYVGRVYRDPDAWSIRPWMIFGDRMERHPGGYGGSNANRRPLKSSGAHNRMEAAICCAIMASSKVVREIAA